jgi:hypothetical protein
MMEENGQRPSIDYSKELFSAIDSRMGFIIFPFDKRGKQSSSIYILNAAYI